MVEIPPPIMVMVLPSIVATDVFELEYVNSPSLFVVGDVIVKSEFPSALDMVGKLLKTVVIGVTTNNAVIVLDKYFSVLACSAVMVEVPAPIIVTTSPSIVATSVLELV